MTRPADPTNADWIDDERSTDGWTDDFISADGYSSFNDVDTPAEVDAVFRIQRRIAFGHFAVFLVVTLGVGFTLVGLQWAAESQVFGGFSPGFALAGIGLYVFFVVIGVAAASLANGVEDRMMGGAVAAGRHKETMRSICGCHHQPGSWPR